MFISHFANTQRVTYISYDPMMHGLLHRLFGCLLALALALAPAAHAIAMIDGHVTKALSATQVYSDSTTSFAHHPAHEQGAPEKSDQSSCLAASAICCLGGASCGLALDLPVASDVGRAASDVAWVIEQYDPPDRSVIPSSPPPRTAI